jgi:hypothetical protein
MGHKKIALYRATKLDYSYHTYVRCQAAPEQKKTGATLLRSKHNARSELKLDRYDLRQVFWEVWVHPETH